MPLRLPARREAHDAFFEPRALLQLHLHEVAVPLGHGRQDVAFDGVRGVGMQRPLADYSRDEVLMLIDVVVTRYQDSMLAEHERMAARDRQFLEQRYSRTQVCAQYAEFFQQTLQGHKP